MVSNAPERQRRILRWLEEREFLETADLRERLGVTAMTVWRDTVFLEAQGLVRRSRGRVTRADRKVQEPDFRSKVDRALSAKERIAAYAARHLVASGDTLAIDGGTTVATLARQTLPAGLSVFTNSLFTAEGMLQNASRPVVYCCGGLLRPESGTFIGPEALRFFGRRRIQRYFLSATGVDTDAGITDLTLEDNEVKQAMASASSEVVLLADQSKFGTVSLMQVLPWRRIHHLVTDASVEVTRPIERIHPGLKVHRVYPSGVRQGGAQVTLGG